MDPRYEKLAQVLVQYSAKVKPGQLVRVAGSTVTEPLIIAVYREVVRAGAHPDVVVTPDECKRILLEEGSDEQLSFENPLLLPSVDAIDCFISMWGQKNSKALSTISPQKSSLLSQARRPFFKKFLGQAAEGKLSWVGTQFPCESSAQDAEMSLSEYEDFVFRSGFLYEDDPVALWKKLSVQQQKLCDFLMPKKELRFVTPQGTDLTLGIEGRKWLNCDGHENFPDGEVFTGPIETATQGTVKYSFPAVHGGRESDGIELTFRDGKVVEAKASKGEEFLLAMLDQDPGARVLGEIAIGTNYAIQQYSKNTLFDEKIGGTFHAAVGAAYPESGGTNESGLHWDMVCDLRQGGQIFVDGELISENGRFLNPEFPQPLS
ncbi:aminopeptidase [Blastopirellula marina]|uniref:Aminopeptidase n=1 Tax=Blastopirellula marina TaxID=124 RepID=A0A2S8GRH9_9BACT|nr:aminopeptidase [Blastopirellula marina]PQO47033.1 aminopeptidase [Blastopirellula marina]